MTPKETMILKFSFAALGLILMAVLTYAGKVPVSDLSSMIKWATVTLIGGSAVLGSAVQLSANNTASLSDSNKS